MSKQFKWPLNDSHFTFLDRLKICKFFLNPNNRWTQGEQVKKYEEVWREFTGAKYVVMVSSGSTANTLIAQHAKDTNKNPNRNIVVFPAVTWQTSISPWVREGFEPHFIDVSLLDFSIDINALSEYLKLNGENVHTVFVTSLIGCTPDVDKLERICHRYGAMLKLDNCENSFGTYKYCGISKHICSQFTCSTSNYFGHQTTNGGESGLIFTDNEDEYVYYLMNRSHGLVRTLVPYQNVIGDKHFKAFRNPDVDVQFDFATLGNNYRNTDIGAFIGLLDFARINDYIYRRKHLYRVFSGSLNSAKYLLPATPRNREHVGFCLPIVFRNRDASRVAEAKKFCEQNGIEHRPIISGNLLRQTCYKQYADYKKFQNAEYLHEFGFYVGLYPNLKESQILTLTTYLNNL